MTSKVEGEAFVASHVDIYFRDAYLTRADMWRLVFSELSGRSVYRGQKIYFMSTVKAQIKAVFCHGRKVPSAFFGPQTKPVFRSESSRIVLLIQMAKEMWDFDADGGGEILYQKAIDGFLPELFGRWQDAGARHLLSIVLFSRMEYEHRSRAPSSQTVDNKWDNQHEPVVEGWYHDDFYRVISTNVLSGQKEKILASLKRELQVFLRDISSKPAGAENRPSSSQGEVFPHSRLPEERIAGLPTPATRGNILEAINIACTQLVEESYDHDLVHSNMSMIILSPGTGSYDVDTHLLRSTGQTLTDAGLRIDLVCLAKMPLHSVPVFRCKTHDLKDRVRNAEPGMKSAEGSIVEMDATNSHLQRPLSWFPGQDFPRKSPKIYPWKEAEMEDDWGCGVPHWIDISFWPPSTVSAATHLKGSRLRYAASGGPAFTPRIRMYEIQMMGIFSEISNISVPLLLPTMFSSSGLKQVWRWPLTQVDARKDAYLSKNQGPRLKRGWATVQPVPGLEASKASPKVLGATFWDHATKSMDEYDDALFRLHGPFEANASLLQRDLRLGKADEIRTKLESKRRELRPSHTSDVTDSYRLRMQLSTATMTSSMSKTIDVLNKPIASQNKPQNRSSSLSHRTSLGFRGFGANAPKANPVTELSSEMAYPRALKTSAPKAESQRSSTSLVEQSEHNEPGNQGQEKTSALQPVHAGPGTRVTLQGTQPIAIKPLLQTTLDVDRSKKVPKPSSLSSGPTGHELGNIDESGNGEEQSQCSDLRNPVLSQQIKVPWFTLLDPSNVGTFSDSRVRLGRWQHIYPKPLRASEFKWKSMRAPASMPLTADCFPSLAALLFGRTKSEYMITNISRDAGFEVKAPCYGQVRRMIELRLALGFQVLLETCQREAGAGHLAQHLDFFNDDNFGSSGREVAMSNGNEIHIIQVTSDDNILVEVYIDSLKAAVASTNVYYRYKAYVRTDKKPRYQFQPTAFLTSLRNSLWQSADESIAGQEKIKLDADSERFRSWAARFVLIPDKELVSSARATPGTENDNDEEISLEGINQLTQVLQKNRYIPEDERVFESEPSKRNISDPLDVIYRTSYPSAVIATELSESFVPEKRPSERRGAVLLHERERFERSDLNIAVLAKAMQEEQGVKFMDRRWHMRMYKNCFTGIDLTTWLLRSFGDVDSRENARQLGNELMKSGLFVHVTRKHEFRDGNFLYQMCNEYALPRDEDPVSLRAGQPSTSADDTTVNRREPPESVMDRSSTSEQSSAEQPAAAHPSGWGRRWVALSKALVYDVGHRNRSVQPQLIELHYDCISVAGECYHLRIDWTTATPKLIEDSIKSWASLVERYGLRLVRVPIKEVSSLITVLPFADPYMVKLAMKPPDTDASIERGTSPLTASLRPRFAYHREILKKFDFALDFEAATDFPASVEVTYSWGAPDYGCTQYVSRYGDILAQINEHGDFLFLANPFCEMRELGTKVSQKICGHRERVQGDASSAAATKPLGVPDLQQDSLNSAIPILGTTDDGLLMARPDSFPVTVANLARFCSDERALQTFYQSVQEVHR